MLSLNVRGIRSLEKRKALFIWLQKQNADIIFLQETYSTKDIENAWKSQWKGPIFFAHGSNRSCGVSILVKESLEFDLQRKIADESGRCIVLNATVQGSNYILGNIYAPNKVREQCSFFENLQEKLDSLIIDDENYKVIIGGDFNVVNDLELDCCGGTPKEKESTKILYSICSNYDLIDIWRTRNPDRKLFTWKQKKPLVQRRLDFWLISDICQDEVEETNIKTAIRTDHSAITISFNSLDEQARGPSYWKFNSSLVDDDYYVSMINEKIPEWLEEFNEVLDKRVLWDLIKYRVRQFTIKYAKEKARKRRQELLQVEASLKQAEEMLATDPSETNHEKLADLKMKYDSLFNYLAKGAIIRSRATWYEQGEKSNKYFLGLESHRGTKSCIRRLFSSDGLLTVNPSKIMKEIEKFYSDLYASNDESVNRNHPFLQRAEIPKLSDEMRDVCEGRLSPKECFDCLQSFQNNKSPGNDGLTAEFYKTFWNSIGNLVVDSLNYSYECGELSNTQKQAIITLIEKKGKDKRNIGNWRPISLINVDAKIGSKAIALRLQKVLAEIIHFNQNAYVKGRTILDAVRTIDDILEYTERKKINGLLVAIDFQKAFDSVNRNFMIEVLSAFNFGPSLIHWVQTFYKNISSTVMNNGYTTTPFQVLRGVRQGDPLSPYLFIICLEILAINVRLNKNIKGIIVDKEEIKLEIFADDLTSFLRDRTSLNALFETIDCFSSCSGLKVNYEKTEAMWLGNHNPNPPRLASCSDRNITVKKVIKILGIHFTYNQTLWKKLNFDEVLKSISEKLHFWNWRNLTILGRIQIVKTFVVPIFMYRAGLVCMHKDIIKETNKILFNFIWKGKDRVKRSSLVSDVENGGLRAPHLESAIKTQRIMCCKKFVDSQQSSWKIVLLHYLKPVGGKLVLGCGFDIKKLPIKLPKFYEECFQIFAEHSVATAVKVQCLNDISRADIIIWNNKHICVDGKSIFHHTLYEKGIITLENLISDNNDLIIKNLHSSMFTPVEVFSLMQVIDALPIQWRNSLTACGHKSNKAFVLNYHIKLSLNDQEVLINKAVSKNVYHEVRSKYETPPTAQKKYSEQYSSACLEWREIYSLPSKVLMDTKSREFQYKILNRYLTTNSFLHKIGLIASPLCTFCGLESESLEHLLITCSFTSVFWLDFIDWCRNINIVLEELSDIDKLFGVWKRKEDFLLLNHLLILAKHYIHECRKNNNRPSRRVFFKIVNYTYQLELYAMKSKNQEDSQNLNLKWKKYTESL